MNKAVVRYFKQAIAETKLTGDIEHLKEKASKYLNSDKICDETKKVILSLFTESETGKKKIMTKEILMNDKDFKVAVKKKFVECDSKGKRIYKDQIVIDNRYIKVTESLVRG